MFPEDFPQRLERLEEESGLTWSGACRPAWRKPPTLQRWRRGAHPNALQLFALLELATSFDLPELLSSTKVPTYKDK